MKKSIILLALLALAISPLAFADDNKTEGKKEEEKTEEVVAEEEKESEDWGSFSLEGRVLAESTCTAMQGGSGVGYAIRRECNKKGPNCAKICREAVDPARKDLKLVCHNSIHVSDAVGSLEPGKVGLSTFRYNSCLVRGCGPNYCCCRAQPKAGVRIRRSCLSIVKNGESKGSGTYWVNPKGGADTAFKVHCDMNTQQGGWTLAYAYTHHKGENKKIKNKMPLAPLRATAGQLLQDAGFNAKDVRQVRFYCSSSAHSRRVHFRTNDPAIRKSLLSGDGALNVDSFKSGYKTMEGHTAYLPRSTQAVASSSLTANAFYDSKGHHWDFSPAKKAGDSHFRCDDGGDPNASYTFAIYFR
eukprot:TRINITY_DN638_c0_g1_i1.p1 TRINITY_DN638_c0_g1~~TRINITY_DN638_c0_g1_i1.p1  ORF type:complete len:357 (-),score=126.25 TRINITY_DN638_c0_g1_i1:180-1250(-)